ncbi:MAG: NgoFVII family restriction endonuclease, partial [Thermomicrobiales bacterium]|nr:NgoFVII family restriction endonuclease [Thermomicrobiales bacterium]
MPRIFDNLSDATQLLAALRQTMADAERVDFCVGYFNLRGWRGIAQAVDELAAADAPQCRVLVGMHRPPDEELGAAFRFSTEPPVDNATVLRRRKEAAAAFRRQLTIGGPTNADETALRRLGQQIRCGRVRIKLFLQHPLHAKLYLVRRGDPNLPLVGFVGSSNLTFSGLRGQGELNVDVLDHDAAGKLQEWFDDRWDNRWCVDISDELVRIIDESWAGDRLIPPYHVYLKMAYHLSRDARAGLSEFTIPADFGAELFDFQIAAVKIAAHHLNRYGGVLIGDVVGLGKTLMATALARVFQEDQGAETLIICPKNLVSMWNAYREKHRLLARVLPLSMATRELPDMRRYRVVLIDESHNLRNREGRTYRAIQDYVTRNESLCILLSATPYNKTFLDLGSQLRLFVAPDADLGIRPESLIATLGESEFIRRHQCGPRTLAAFEKSEEPEDWRLLMRRYMVRRTRGFIEANYAKRDNGQVYITTPDGRRFYFPVRRPKNVAFAFDPSGADPYPRMFSPAVVNAIDELRLPRYGLGNYIAPKPARRPTTAERQALDGLSRAGVRLKGFCRTNLFKRLESGGPAFLQSVERHILRNHVFLYA